MASYEAEQRRIIRERQVEKRVKDRLRAKLNKVVQRLEAVRTQEWETLGSEQLQALNNVIEVLKNL